MNEHKLIEKLLRIEALHAGATTRGERIAAARAIHEDSSEAAEREQMGSPAH